MNPSPFFRVRSVLSTLILIHCAAITAHGEIIVANAPDGAKGDLRLEFDDTATPISAPIYLRTSDKAEVEIKAFHGFVLMGANQIAGATLEVAPVRTAAADSPVMKLPAEGKAQAATLKISNLPKSGSFTGKLLAEVGNEWIEIATLKLERAPKPQLTAWPGTGVAALTSSRREFQHTFRIDSANSSPIEKLTVDFAGFQAPSGTLYPPKEWTVNGKKFTTPIPLEGLGTLRVEVKAELPEIGLHHATLRLTYHGASDPRQITVDRKELPEPIEIHGLSTASGILGGIAGKGAPVWAVLHATTKTKVSDISLLKFTRSGPKQTAQQARYEGVEFQTIDGKPSSLPLSLEAGQSLPIRLKLKDIRDPGEYAATLRVTPDDGKPSSKDFNLTLKQDWWIAALCIALGVFISTRLRAVITKALPTLAHRQRAALLAEELDKLRTDFPAREPIEEEVLQILQSSVETLDRSLETDDAKTPEKSLDDLDQKLSIFRDWVNARRAVKGLPDTRQEPFRLRISDAEKYLREEKSAAGDYEARHKDVRALRGEIETAWREELRERRKKLLEEAELRHGSMTDPARKTELAQILAETKKLLDKDAPEARQEFDRLRGQFAGLLAEDFQATLDPMSAPPGLDDAAWQELKSRIAAFLRIAIEKKASDPDAATDAYGSAVQTYLETVTGKLLAELKECERRAQARPDPEKTEKLSEIAAIGQQLASVEADIKAGQLQKAWKSYQDALASFQALPRHIRLDPGQAGVAVPPVGGVGLSEPGMIPRGAAEWVGRSREPAKLAALQAKKKWLERGVTIALGLIAVVLGLKVLWVDDPTWGGWTGWLTAFFWGLGLHQVTTFQSTAHLAESFKK